MHKWESSTEWHNCKKQFQQVFSCIILTPHCVMCFYNSLHARSGRLPRLILEKRKLFYFSVFKKIIRVVISLSWLHLLYLTFTYLDAGLKVFFINIYDSEMKDPWHRTISKHTHLYRHTHPYTNTHKCHNPFKLTHLHRHAHTQSQIHTHTTPI